MGEKIEYDEKLNSDEKDWDDVTRETGSWRGVTRGLNRERFCGRSISSAQAESFHDMFFCEDYQGTAEERIDALTDGDDGKRILKGTVSVTDRGLYSLN